MISEHTKLINCFIGLTKKDITFPNSLREKGYFVDSVEPHFRNSMGKEISGDILLTSRKADHSLILECKGGKDANGEHLKSQVERYKALTKENVIPHISTSEPNKLSFDVTFAFSKKKDDELPDYKDIGKDFSLLIKKENSIEKDSSYGSFKNEELNILFSRGIPIPKEIPTKYYPFGCYDNLLSIAPFILQSIVKLTIKRRNGFAQEDILNDAHPLWKYFDESHKKEMREKLESIMKLKYFEKIKDYITITKTRYKPHTKSLQALQETCEKIKQEIQKDSEQKKLEF